MPKTNPSAVAALREALQAIEKSQDLEAWTRQLVERKQKEIELHDQKRDPTLAAESIDIVHPNKKYYDTTQSSVDKLLAWISESAPGSVFLDYACGNGDIAIRAAEAGAALAIGIDISPVSVENARRAAVERGVADRTYFLVGDCESTRLPDNCVDYVVCNGCLHHLDLSYAFPELRRVMKPGARLFALEALAYNPVIIAYRRFTPHLRTAWEKEHILSLKEVRFARRFFDVASVEYHHLFVIAVTPLRRTKAFGPALKVASAMDRLALKVPALNRLAWMFSFVLVKREEG